MIQRFILAAHKNLSWYLQMNIVLYNTRDKGSVCLTALSWMVTSKFHAAGWREREGREQRAHMLGPIKKISRSCYLNTQAYNPIGQNLVIYRAAKGKWKLHSLFWEACAKPQTGDSTTIEKEENEYWQTTFWTPQYL